ncbi:hypothetical protein FCOIX_10371 [Fusarium coicis]|nr:hypothetical protein FCOIX_10371 [Fusarium coicis]
MSRSSDRVFWRCSPVGGLRDAMYRLALETLEQGEYETVEILSTPKTTTGGRKAAIHFKVRLHYTDNGREATHDHKIRIEHRDANGRVWNFAKNRRPPNYDYSTLQAKNGPPSNCPRRRREQREAAAAATQGYEDGWYADPYAAESGKTWRYFANGAWTDQTA